MATPTTREDLLELLRKSGVLKPEVLQKYLDEHPELPGDPKVIVSQLVQARLLTAFQAKLLLAGRYKGFRLGAYILLDQLGQGGMGAVYLAEHDTLHRKAAIKVLPPGGNKITVERFLREARAAAALDHPNIVRMHDVGREGEVHFLVMEYVEGQTLDKLVSSTAPLPAQRAVEYVAQACAGLQHACERGFIHRDIKPANLILAKDGTIKILDMGLARSNEKQDQLTEALDAGAIVGTADYISPEQAMNDSAVDIRTDIYSLGATFFAIVTGRPPFDGPTASKLVQHQVKDPPSVTMLDRTFPKGLSSVIAKMMAKKPADRYSTPSEVIEALQPWQNESMKLMAGLSQTMAGQTGSMSKLTGRLNPPEPPKKKNRGMIFAVLGGLGAALLLGIGIAVAMALNGGGSQSQSKTGSTAAVPTAEVPPPTTKPDTTPTTAPKLTPPATKPEIVKPPDPPIPAKALLTFDAGSIPEFTVVKSRHMTVGGSDAQFPAGIYVHSHKPDSKAEFRREVFAGKPAIAMFSTAGMPSGQLVFDLEDRMKLPLVPEKRYSATIEYAAVGKGSGVMTAAGPAPKFIKLGGVLLAPTMGKFQTKTFSFLRTPGVPARLAVDVTSTGAENAIYVHRVELAEESVATDAGGKVAYKLDLGEGKPLTVTMATTMSQAIADRREMKETNRIGTGSLPTGWIARSIYAGAESETEIAVVDGQPAIGFRTSRLPTDPPKGGGGGTSLYAPKFELPPDSSTIVKLRFEYRASAKAGRCSVKFKPEGGTAYHLQPLTATDSAWGVYTHEIDMMAFKMGAVEITNSGPVGETIWIRNFTIADAKPPEPKK